MYYDLLICRQRLNVYLEEWNRGTRPHHCPNFDEREVRQERFLMMCVITKERFLGVEHLPYAQK